MAFSMLSRKNTGSTPTGETNRRRDGRRGTIGLGASDGVRHRGETGLRLYASEERNGIEFPVDGGRIDLLAVDRNGKFVAIELKLSQGRNKSLGQLLYYSMGWVDRHLGEGPCRGFIIASDITEELSIAVARVPGVRLANYRMSFAVELMGPP